MEITPQLEHAASASRKNCSQVDRIISLFHEAGEGTWVPMPQIARVMSPHDSGVGNCPPRRLFDVRQRLKPLGFRIKNRKEYRDGQTFSFYCLIRDNPCSSVANPKT